MLGKVQLGLLLSLVLLWAQHPATVEAGAAAAAAGAGGRGGRFGAWRLRDVGDEAAKAISGHAAKYTGVFAHREVNMEARKRAATSGARPEYKLTFYGSMVAGAVSRSIAQTAMHPANVVKTLLQTKGSFQAILPLSYKTLTRGAGAQFLLSLPTGALHFAVLERTKAAMVEMFPLAAVGASAAFDFASSSVATILCSVANTPQMVLTNRIMAGVYPNLVSGVRSVIKESGMKGFYAGWFPGLIQKIPSYGLTWMFFQQAKDCHYHFAKRIPTASEDFWLGCFAAALSVTVMIPMDSVKTRLVTQTAMSSRQYKGIIDCFSSMIREEGIGSLYNSLTPRLISVVPQVGLQYGSYELIKRSLAEGAMQPYEDVERQEELVSATD